MNSRYERDTDFQARHDPDGPDREISLGTATILGIFFALALLCAVFFGFGYSLGRHSAPPAPSSAEASSEPDSAPSKPSPVGTATPSRSDSSDDPLAQPAGAEVPHSDSSSEAADKAPPEAAPLRTSLAARTSETRSSPAAKSSSAKPLPATAPVGPGTAVVQVAAVSHQEDANLLSTALKARGYDVSIRQVPQDKLLHVQVGPFATKKEADTMRQRLQADGYNAIVK